MKVNNKGGIVIRITHPKHDMSVYYFHSNFMMDGIKGKNLPVPFLKQCAEDQEKYISFAQD